MYLPVIADEAATCAGYADQQIEALRAAALGLTEKQARETPCRSALSVAGILKHIVYGLRGALRDVSGESGPTSYDEDAFAAYARSFVLGEDETTAGVLAELDEIRPVYRAALAAADPDAPFLAPAAPWMGITEPQPTTLRYAIQHQIEELARHAGHIDIIREQIDGLSVQTLMLTRAGAPANPFFEPYVPAAGTIDA